VEPLGKYLGGARSQLASPQPPNEQRATSGSSGATEAQLRFSMLTKFFSFYPQPGGEDSTQMRLQAYYSELADIHPMALGYAFRRMVRHQKHEYMPKVHQIRREAAYVIRAAQAGRDPALPDPAATPEAIDERRYLELAPPKTSWQQLCAGPALLRSGS
jgi:hypothetical protein